MYNFDILFQSCRLTNHAAPLQFCCDTSVSLIIHTEQVISIFFSCFVMNKPQVLALITILLFISFNSALPLEKFEGKRTFSYMLSVGNSCYDSVPIVLHLYCAGLLL